MPRTPYVVSPRTPNWSQPSTTSQPAETPERSDDWATAESSGPSAAAQPWDDYHDWASVTAAERSGNSNAIKTIQNLAAAAAAAAASSAAFIKDARELAIKEIEGLAGERQRREEAEMRVADLESMNENAFQEIEACVAELEGERQKRKEAEMRVASLEKQLRCVVCWERDRNVHFLPCFHVVSCDVCQYGVDECPVCRKPVEGRLKATLA